MTSEPVSRTSDADDGSWESLAENLFGIDFKHSALAQGLSADDLRLDDELLEPATPARQTAEPEVEGRAVEASHTREVAQAPRRPPAALALDEEDLSFGAELGFDEPEELSDSDVQLIERIAAEPAAGPPAVDDDQSTDAFDASLDIAGETEAEETDEAAPAGEEDDTYWDALKDWEWDDTEESTAAAPTQRPGRRGARPAKYVPRAVVEQEEPAWAEGRDEYIADPEFGAGLVDVEQPPPVREPRRPPERRASESARPAEPTRREPAARDEDAEGERGRRRGRRRRRRDPAESVGTGERREEREPRRAVEAPDVPDMEVENEPGQEGADFEAAGPDDEFGLGLDVERSAPTTRPEREPRHGGRRSRSGRRGERGDGGRERDDKERPARAPAPERHPPLENEAGAEPEIEDDESEVVDEAVSPAQWESIPTWEEAVALLINPPRSSARDSSGGPGGERRPSSRPRGNGGRRGRRRR